MHFVDSKLQEVIPCDRKFYKDKALFPVFFLLENLSSNPAWGKNICHKPSSHRNLHCAWMETGQLVDYRGGYSEGEGGFWDMQSLIANGDMLIRPESCRFLEEVENKAWGKV